MVRNIDWNFCHAIHNHYNLYKLRVSAEVYRQLHLSILPRNEFAYFYETPTHFKCCISHHLDHQRAGFIKTLVSVLYPYHTVVHQTIIVKKARKMLLNTCCILPGKLTQRWILVVNPLLFIYFSSRFAHPVRNSLFRVRSNIRIT